MSQSDSSYENIDIYSFEFLVKALSRAAAKLSEKPKKEIEEESEKVLISGKLQERITKVMDSLNRVFDESDKRMLYAKQRLYELREMPGIYETQISDFLLRIENAINSYINEKRAREERIKKLEEKILSKVKKARLKKEISNVLKSISEEEAIHDKLLLLKKKYYKLISGDQMPEKRAQLEIIRKRIQQIEKILEEKNAKHNS
ncbi:MAG: hypothetical protein QXW00_01675 [Candidatus Woesearchaeota archaeon]